MTVSDRSLRSSSTKCADYATGPAFDDGLTPIPEANKLASSGSSSFVTIEGVIVNDLKNTGYNGIYVQATTSHHSSPPRRGEDSQAIFVYCGSGCSSLDGEEGDYVRVNGRLSEFSNTPQLTSATVEVLTPAVRARRSDCPNLAFGVHVVDFELPQPKNDDFRSYLGMLLRSPDELVITDLFGLQYGQLSLAKERIINPTMRVPPGSDDYFRVAEENSRSFIVLDDVAGGTCPVPQLYFNPSVGIRSGWGVEIDSNVVMTYFQPTDQFFLVPNQLGRDLIPRSFNQDLNPRDDKLQLTVSGGVKLAGLNMLNYFTTLGCSSCRGADNEEEYERQSRKLYATIRELDADVLGLQEVQNFDGEVLETLIEELNNFLGSPGKYSFIAAGKIGSDSIKNAIIYQSNRVTPLGNSKTLTFTDPSNKSRPALAQTFEFQSKNDKEEIIVEKFTFVSNHLKSKGSSCSDSNTLEGEGNCGFTRLKHAEQLMKWLKTDPTNSNSNNFILVGDFNSYKEERSIKLIEDYGFINLAERDVSSSDLYSTSFGGQFGTLDYIFASKDISKTCGGTKEWHVNSDEPVIIDYNDEQYSFPSSCETKPEEYYDLNVFRASDHDPIITSCFVPGLNQKENNNEAIRNSFLGLTIIFFIASIILTGIYYKKRKTRESEEYETESGDITKHTL